ncbi:MAG: hypothetical protein KatS3mg102_2476 [Planctomycetota bacterium]|nr:MAG: hypothetical protein KatS3mg102_2476 [Planctomycetota bacterium]
MLDVLEKLLWGLTALVIVAVVALAVVIEPRSAIPREHIDWEFRLRNAPAYRAAAAAGDVALPETRARTFAPAAAGPGTSAGGTSPPRAQPGAPGPERAPAERAPGEWRQPQPPAGQVVGGVYHAPPVYLPASWQRRYSTFQDLVDVGQTAASDPVEIDGQEATEITAIDPDSPLAAHLGLRAGDIIVKVNGYPAARSRARELYEILKNERDFEVEIIRNGQRQVLHYQIR